MTNADKDRLTDEFYEEWDKQNFDIVICPGFPFPAPKPTHAARMISGYSREGSDIGLYQSFIIMFSYLLI